MLSPAQIKTLNGRLWPAACQAQGWPRNDREAVAQGFASERAFRLKTLSDILGRELMSSSEIGLVEEFTEVKNRLLALTDNLRAAGEAGDRVPNALRTRRWCALRDIQCLLLYVDEAYVRAILRERFHRAEVGWEVFDALPLQKIIAEFKDVRVLDELLSTLNERLHARAGTRRKAGYRVQAGHTLHEMRTQAGVKCDCKECAGPRVVVVVPAVAEEEPELAGNPF